MRENEDLVTATLIERLSYLPGAIAWTILAKTYEGQLPAFRMASFDSIEFWPRWDYSVDDRSHVEPDAFFQLTLGDPAQRWHVIFEAKHRAEQYAKQWRLEQDAYLARPDEEDETLPDRIVFMALGGLRGSTGAAAARMIGQQVSDERQRRGGAAVEILTVAADWSDMAQALAEVEPHAEHEARLISDMIEALAIFGYRHLTLSDGLLHAGPFEDWQSSMDTLGWSKTS
ncbi:hypothetical protein [uncultured Limimaricola sp.]|uniref:hypothetical protein n=1 Tax=uncultured Limimaricola sp. TaxID=2211667 RepID=UPI0030FC9C00